MIIKKPFLQKSLLLLSAVLVSSLTWALEPIVKSPQVDTPKRLLLIGNSYPEFDTK